MSKNCIPINKKTVEKFYSFIFIGTLKNNAYKLPSLSTLTWLTDGFGLKEITLPKLN